MKNFELSDLIEPREHPGDKKNKSRVYHTAEILIDEVVRKNGKVIDIHETGDIDPSNILYSQEYFLRGRLSDGTQVRTVKSSIGVKADANDLPKDKWGDRVEEELEKKMPKAGEIMAVYWHSEEELPKPFKNEIYVYQITHTFIPLVRNHETDMAEYLKVLEAKSRAKGDDFEKDEADALKEVKDAITRPSYTMHTIRDNSDKSIKDYILSYAIKSKEVLDKFDELAPKMDDYSACLRMLAGFDVGKNAAWLAYKKSARRPTSMLNEFCIIRDNLPGQIADYLDNLKNRPWHEKITPDDIKYQLDMALKSAAGFAYSNSVDKKMPGSFGHSDRRAKR